MRAYIALLCLLPICGNTQEISSVRSYYDYSIKDTNVFALNLLPFQISYMVELTSEVDVKKIEVDRNLEELSIYVFDENHWIPLMSTTSQTFLVNRKVRYFLIRCNSNYTTAYFLIE